MCGKAIAQRALSVFPSGVVTTTTSMTCGWQRAVRRLHKIYPVIYIPKRYIGEYNKLHQSEATSVHGMHGTVGAARQKVIDGYVQ